MFLACLLVFFPFLILCTIVFTDGASLFEGDACTNNNINGNSRGRCISVYECPWAIEQIKAKQRIDTCNFIGNTPLICCPFVDKKSEVTTKTFQPTGSIVPDVGVGGIGKKKKGTDPSNSPLKNPGVGPSRTVSRARIKCDEYYPPPDPGAIFIFGTGGEKSLAQEFPHMAILGYGNENDKQWKCGGSLISHQHVVTAAHCLNARDFGDVKFVRLGDLDINDENDDAKPQDFTVKTIIPHPQFDPRSVKHDIAILELDRPIELTDYVKPACLHWRDKFDEYAPITATGWGVTEFQGEQSSHLIKVRLKIVPFDDCKKQYVRDGARGNIENAIQVCAGSASDEKLMDTCQGDSGGPLQQKISGSNQHYKIIGITSYGKACGVTKSAGVYTRISAHVPWIESIVFKS